MMKSTQHSDEPLVCSVVCQLCQALMVCRYQFVSMARLESAKPYRMEASLMERHSLTLLHALWIVTLCLVATGCIAEQKIWQYHADSYPPVIQPLIQKRLVVPAFKDSRPRTYEDGETAAILPLIPFVWWDFSRPEAARRCREEVFQLTNFGQSKICPVPQRRSFAQVGYSKKSLLPLARPKGTWCSLER